MSQNKSLSFVKSNVFNDFVSTLLPFWVDITLSHPIAGCFAKSGRANE